MSPPADLTLDVSRTSASAWTVTLRAVDRLLLVDVANLSRSKAREELLSRIAKLAPALDPEPIAQQLAAAGAESWDVARRGDDDRAQGHALDLRDAEPHEDGQDGATLLDDLATRIRRHVVVSPEAVHAIALWILHSWAIDCATTTPRLALVSPLPRCGKSTLLDLLGALVRRPLQAAHATTAALFRIVEASRPTVLLDEIDSFLKDNEEMRGMLNSGHSRTGCVLRVVGAELEPRRFSTFAAKALAGIGRLPATIADRSIVVAMRRKSAGDIAERLNLARIGDECLPLRRRCRRWAEDSAEALRAADPPIPDELDDRAADGWRVLLAIADLAGGDWSSRARSAAVVLSIDRDGSDRTSLARLLGDLRELFEREQAERLASERVVGLLTADADSPWTEYRRGRPLSQKQLADLLRPVDVRPRTIRLPTGQAKGYQRDDFGDAWARYLPSPVARSVPPSQPAQDLGSSGTDPIPDPKT
jgi:hypothetical protein